MYKAFTPANLIPVVLAGFILASMPVLFFMYFALLIFLAKIFVIICVIDLIRKTSWRKKTGLALSLMFMAAIVSLITMYVLNYFHVS